MEYTKRQKVAEIIQTARIQKGMTQQQLADTIKCQIQTINKIENAKYSPNADILYQLAVALQIKITLNNIEI